MIWYHLHKEGNGVCGGGGAAATHPGFPRIIEMIHDMVSSPQCRARRPVGGRGFVKPLAGGEMVTKPIIFEGDELVVNFSTSAAGSVRVEIQDDQRQPIPGYALAESVEIFGDQIDRVVAWKRGPNVGQLAGKPVRLRFVNKDADLYSIRFR